MVLIFLRFLGDQFASDAKQRDLPAFESQSSMRTSANSFLFLRKLLAFGLCNVAKLLFRHRLDHLLGSTLQAGFLYFAALCRQRSTRSHLLSLGTSWHNLVSLPAMRLVAPSFEKESQMFGRTRREAVVLICASQDSTALFSDPPSCKSGSMTSADSFHTMAHAMVPLFDSTARGLYDAGLGCLR